MIESNGMNFILSPEAIDDIIFAMENQDGFFFFDAAEGFCVSEDAVDDTTKQDSEDERYYDIPEWTPAQGFRVMEQFTAQVHNPLLREELREALRQRKGVFRRYKAVLKTVPAIEREWYRFKEQHMRAAVYEWYNELRMLWGLEKIGFEEETEPQLLPQDFTFRMQKTSAVSSDFLQDFINKTAEPCQTDASEMSSTVRTAFSAFTLLTQALLTATGLSIKVDSHITPPETRHAGAAAQTVAPSKENLTDAVLITAHTDDELCAMCLLAAFPHQRCFCIPFLRVLPDYRGLGLGKELLQRACASAEQEESALIFADIGAPPHFITLLERNGFEQAGLLYVKAGSER